MRMERTVREIAGDYAVLENESGGTTEVALALLPDEPLMLKVSRIYRDARRLHGQGPYKDHLWFCVRAGGEDWTGRPTFYFEIGPDYYSYGMGFYSATPAQMEAFRRSIDANPERFRRIAEKSPLPLVADIHFDYRLALAAAEGSA